MQRPYNLGSQRLILLKSRPYFSALPSFIKILVNTLYNIRIWDNLIFCVSPGIFIIANYIDLSKNANFGRTGQGFENLFWRCLIKLDIALRASHAFMHSWIQK